MAGARIEIKVDSRDVDAALSGIEGVLDGDGRTLLFEDIGDYMVGATRDLADEEVSPFGEAWPSLSPRYAARKAKLRPGAPILQFDHHMLGDQLAYQVESDALYVGTGAKQGASQQFGRGGIPARPWLGVNDDDSQAILQIVHAHLAAAAAGPTP